MTAALRRLAMGLRLRLLLALLLVSVAGCRGQAPRTADDVVSGAEAAYALGCVALKAGSAATTAWLSSLEVPTDAQLDRGKRVVGALQEAQGALDRARTAIDEGKDALAELRRAVTTLRVVAGLLGSEAPPGLTTALDEAERVLGAGGES